MSDINPYVDKLQISRRQLVKSRRTLAAKKTAGAELAEVQLQIDAIDRAIIDELAIAKGDK